MKCIYIYIIFEREFLRKADNFLYLFFFLSTLYIHARIFLLILVLIKYPPTHLHGYVTLEYKIAEFVTSNLYQCAASTSKLNMYELYIIYIYNRPTHWSFFLGMLIKFLINVFKFFQYCLVCLSLNILKFWIHQAKHNSPANNKNH